MFFNAREINAVIHENNNFFESKILCIFKPFSLLKQLDGSNPSVDPSDEPDFYEQSSIPA